MILKQLFLGASSYVPGLYSYIYKGTGGTFSARYCYSIWLRHLCMAYKNNLPTQLDTIAEFGPGDSLGIGLAALITGAKKFYAFDVIKHTNVQKNIEIFDELLELFKKHEMIPNETEFPEARPRLESYSFPYHILTIDRLKKALEQKRIESIRNAILNLDNNPNSSIFYYAPWFNNINIENETIDMIYSQAVMEHVDDLEDTYKLMYRWLKFGGFLSNEIDFKCHGLSNKWNGHWTYSKFLWKLLRGKRTYLINRKPYSFHINLQQKIGFQIISSIKDKQASGVKRKHLAYEFKEISDDDMTTSSAFILSVKK